jgi:hypothetical protein
MTIFSKNLTFKIDVLILKQCIMYTIILYAFRFEFLNIKLENTKEEKY